MSKLQQHITDNKIIDICGNIRQIPEEAIFSKNYIYTKQNSTKEKNVHISIVPAKISHDTGRLHRWMNAPHAAAYWQQAWPINRIQHYLMQQINSYHEVYIIYVNNMPAAYVELYPTHKDTLSHYYNAQDNDFGWHLLVGPKPFIGSGLSIAIGHCVLSFLFECKNANRIFCEPDCKNQRMIRFVKKLAHYDKGNIVMKTKVAKLMCCQKNDFTAIKTPKLLIQNPAAIAL